MTERTYTRADFVRWGKTGRKHRKTPYTLTSEQARAMVRARTIKRRKTKQGRVKT